MDAPHHYEINLRLEDLYINLSSDDVYFISKQMDKWFRVLLDDSYVPITLPLAQSSDPAHNHENEGKEKSEPVPSEPTQPATQELPPQPVEAAPPSETIEAPQAPQTAAPPPTPESVPQFSQPKPAPLPEREVAYAQAAPLGSPVAASMPQPEVLPTYAQPQPELDENVKDDFEAVMDSLMKDLESPSEERPASRPLPHEIELGESANLGTMTEKTKSGRGISDMNKVDFGIIDSLSDLFDRANASTSSDYLLLAAYYMTYFEGVDKFSLKRVNSLLVKSGLTPVNHSVLETCLGQGYLAMLPDLTGTADVTEYTLTEDGQSYATHLL